MGDEARWLPSPELQLGAPVDDISKGWKARLIRGDKGSVKALLANLLIALRSAPEWTELLWHDESAHRTVAKKAPPWPVRSVPFVWAEEDDIRLAEWAQLQGIAISPLTAGHAVQAVAAERPFHPIREYVEGVRWDGDGRIDTWLTEYLGASPQEYTAAVGARWLIGAIARVMKPGCKNDCALILEGPQGALKSTALRVLAEPWFSDDLADIGSKDSQLQVRGTWVIEWSELDSMGRVEVARIKAFMSRAVDRFRPPYGHRLIELPRESVFAGTTNSDSYLRDATGARRFWPVRCGAVDIEALRRDRDQLWAEALARFRDGAVWWLDRKPLEEEARLEQGERYETGPWDDMIRGWVKHRDQVSVDEVLRECIVLEASKWTQAHRNHVCRALRTLGWERRRLGRRGSQEYRWLAPGANAE